MYSLLVILLLVACSSGALDSRWKLMWQDEFKGDSLDASKWSARTQTVYGQTPLLTYTTNSVTVKNDNMVLMSNWSSGAKTTMNSGYVDSAGKAYWTYGRYEVSAKIPGGQGMWPALWLLSEIRCWPYGFEFDILETPVNPSQQGQTLNINTAHGTLHFGHTCGENLSNGSLITSTSDLSQGYHTYALEWWPNNATWYLDDTPYHTIEHNTVWKGQPFTMDDTPHFFILNSAVGGWPGPPFANTTFPQYHYIDYVRVYGWEPCTSGCGAHGKCDGTNTLCVCDDRYYGTYCEYYDGGSYKNTFASATVLDDLIDNAAIGSNMLTLTINATGCPGACKYTGGAWSSASGWGSGNFTFVAKSTNINGTGLLLVAAGGDVSYQGFQMVFSGSSPYVLGFQGMGPSYYSNIKLSFDASADFHTYVVQFTLGKSYTVYIDGVKMLTTTSATTVHILPRATLQYSTTYYGPAVPYNGPIHAYLKEASFVSSDTTHTTTSGTPSPTSSGTPSPTSSGTPSPTSSGTPSPTSSGTPAPTSSGTPSPTSSGTPAPSSGTPAPSSGTPSPTSSSSPTPTPSPSSSTSTTDPSGASGASTTVFCVYSCVFMLSLFILFL